VTYTANDEGLGVDTITVAVSTKATAAAPSVPVGSERSARITVIANKDPLVRIAPASCIQFDSGGGRQAYSLTPIDAPKDLTLLYGWSVTPANTNLLTLTVPGATENAFLHQLVGTGNKATLTIKKLSSSVVGFNGDVTGYLYYRGANGQPKSFDDEVIESYARFGAGAVNCNGGTAGGTSS
jgi:hypothetical protein